MSLPSNPRLVVRSVTKTFGPNVLAQAGFSHHQHVPIARQPLNPLQAWLAALGGLSQAGGWRCMVLPEGMSGHGRVTGLTAAWGNPSSSTVGCSARTMSAVPPTLSPGLWRGSSDDSGDSGKSCSARCRSESRQCLSIFITPFAIVGLGPQMWSNCWKHSSRNYSGQRLA